MTSTGLRPEFGIVATGLALVVAASLWNPSLNDLDSGPLTVLALSAASATLLPALITPWWGGLAASSVSLAVGAGVLWSLDGPDASLAVGAYLVAALVVMLAELVAGPSQRPTFLLAGPAMLIGAWSTATPGVIAGLMLGVLAAADLRTPTSPDTSPPPTAPAARPKPGSLPALRMPPATSSASDYFKLGPLRVLGCARAPTTRVADYAMASTRDGRYAMGAVAAAATGVSDGHVGAYWATRYALLHLHEQLTRHSLEELDPATLLEAIAGDVRSVGRGLLGGRYTDARVSISLAMAVIEHTGLGRSIRLGNAEVRLIEAVGPTDLDWLPPVAPGDDGGRLPDRATNPRDASFEIGLGQGLTLAATSAPTAIDWASLGRPEPLDYPNELAARSGVEDVALISLHHRT